MLLPENQWGISISKKSSITCVCKARAYTKVANHKSGFTDAVINLELYSNLHKKHIEESQLWLSPLICN